MTEEIALTAPTDELEASHAAMPSGPTRASRRRRWRFPVVPAIAGVAILLGMGIFQYPHVASWFSQYNQSQLIVDLAEEQQDDSDPALHREIVRADEYNKLLVGGVILEANANKPKAESTAENSKYDYNELLKATDTGVMGRLRVPGINVDLPIYHGTDDYTLTQGVGHLQGTALPVGGESRHSVLTAHRGLPEATLFNDLDKVKIGDRFTVEVFGEVLTYEVNDTRVVEPEDTDSLRVVPGEDLVTLVTCTPLGLNTHRILVTGERVTPTPVEDIQAAGERPDIPGFPWWTVILGGTILAVGVYVWRAGYPRKTAADALRVGESSKISDGEGEAP